MLQIGNSSKASLAADLFYVYSDFVSWFSRWSTKQQKSENNDGKEQNSNKDPEEGLLN